jgi:hypothetical protein
MATDRFFSATVLGGRLHVRDMPDHGPWEPSRLRWEPEEYVEIMLKAMMARKIQTREELEAVMEEPMGPSPTQYVWIHESLVDEACRLWEQMVADLS